MILWESEKFTRSVLKRDQLKKGKLTHSVLLKFNDESIGIRFKDIDSYIPKSPVTAILQVWRHCVTQQVVETLREQCYSSS